ncbi:hypothetical protein GCM10018793_07440 [Streptomyces sulfonofaciens]|uniref:Uncharacterized protein n=1 Tax=Streptomyces sulfonofaciens TaxID=68272 RepID=A0A919FUD8_9ACTN|nr:hypothetical protein GCM10018793_07440 [Streptomyces sulfonofaciens]
MSLLPDAAVGEGFAEASRFRYALYACPPGRGYGSFEPADALLCAPRALRSAVEPTLLPEHRDRTGPAPGDRLVPRHRHQASATTWEEPTAARRHLSPCNGRKVKEQA